MIMIRFLESSALILFIWSRSTSSQALQPPGAHSPLVEACGSTHGIVCVDKYASVLPFPFYRNTSVPTNDFRDTYVPSDSSFSLVSNASFVVFDQNRGLELLGNSPSNEFIFTAEEIVHEAPVYIPSVNRLYFSQLERGFLPLLMVDLNSDPPALSEYLPDPPVYTPNGGTAYDNGTKLLFGASGVNASIGDPPTQHAASLTIVDPIANTSTVILNNYFGLPFNGFDDLCVHPVTGDIFFTDPDFSYYQELTDRAPVLPTATYRFNPSTGALALVDETLVQPNGISISPDGATLYISDTAVIDVAKAPAGSRFGPYNPTLAHTIYAFDISNNGTRVSNKRSFYLSQTGVPDGLKVSREGYILTATGSGVDVIDEFGQLILRVQTNFTVNNFAFAGENLNEMWMVGQGGVGRVRWNIQGQLLA